MILIRCYYLVSFSWLPVFAPLPKLRPRRPPLSPHPSYGPVSVYKFIVLVFLCRILHFRFFSSFCCVFFSDWVEFDIYIFFLYISLTICHHTFNYKDHCDPGLFTCFDMLWHVTHNCINNFIKGLLPLVSEAHCGYTSLPKYVITIFITKQFFF